MHQTAINPAVYGKTNDDNKESLPKLGGFSFATI